jgi:nicotinic acid mononucleotide adenylyltransferase
VIERPDAVKENDDEFNLLDIDALEISATEIRARLLRGESVSQMVPAAVLAYIEEKGLYVSA